MKITMPLRVVIISIGLIRKLESVFFTLSRNGWKLRIQFSSVYPTKSCKSIFLIRLKSFSIALARLLPTRIFKALDRTILSIKRIISMIMKWQKDSNMQKKFSVKSFSKTTTTIIILMKILKIKSTLNSKLLLHLPVI